MKKSLGKSKNKSFKRGLDSQEHDLEYLRYEIHLLWTVIGGLFETISLLSKKKTKS